MRNLRIAIDIDNTLLNYEDLFDQAAKLENLHINETAKNDIKKYIRNDQSNWPELWVRIQGQCYGNLISEAPYYKDALSTIGKLINDGHEIELVSHKSKNSLCGRFNLHKACLDRIENDFKTINFFEKRKEKIDYINSKNFDYIIDDLEIVLNGINDDVISIHFNTGFSNYLQAHNWNEIYELIYTLNEIDINSVLKVGKQTYKVSSNSNTFYLKKFNNSKRKENELGINHFLSDIENASFLTPETIFDRNQFILYKDMKSAPISFDNSFISKYNSAIREINDSNLIGQRATHGVLNSDDFINNILSRLDSYHFENKDQLIRIYTALKNRESKNRNLEVMVCQPDMLKNNFGLYNETLCLFDFESFGIDALIRPILNAIHHNGQSLNQQEALNLFESHRSMANNKEEFDKAFFEFFDHNALEWLIIMFNKAYNSDDPEFIQLVQQHMEKMIYNLNKSKSVLSWKSELYDGIFNSISRN